LKWSFRLGDVAGIPLRVHATFPLLLGYVALLSARSGASLAGTLQGLVYVLALFACVVLHELGHALTARRFGIVTRDITLLPIGGVARLERMPEDPWQELWVALAGPAVNVAIAVFLALVLALAGEPPSLQPLGVAEGPFLQRLLQTNVALVLFNLLPAFPMDGGRVLRALLATRLPHVRATRLAASLGRGMALLFGLAGILGLASPFLVLIALFVWIGASQEAAAVEIRSSLAGVPVRRAMLTEFRVLRPSDPLSRAVEMVLAGSQQDFPVLDQDRVVGVLLRSDLIAALSRAGPDAAVAGVMRTEFATATSAEPLEAALPRLRSAAGPLPVLEGGRLVGLVTAENVGEFLAIEASTSIRREG
jgi:Zn-dependent protease/CBS domain-containing protein